VLTLSYSDPKKNLIIKRSQDILSTGSMESKDTDDRMYMYVAQKHTE